MTRILLKTTIPFAADDWHVGRFALLQAHLRSLGAGDEVTARDRVAGGPGGGADARAGARSGGGRVIADSSFHHFCDCNWDPAAGAPSFVPEPWGDGIQRSPEALADARRYVENAAGWLAGG